ncbi:MAG: LysR family transcriptional regulator [Polyangiaceae bacterium]
MQKLRVEDLALFCQVVEQGSLSAAARRHGTSLSSVSRRLRELERHFGSQLLERTTRNLAITDAGQALYQRSTQVLLELESLGEQIREDQEPAGVVRLLVPSLLPELTFGSLGEFLDAHPKLHLEWETNDQPDAEAFGYDIVVRVAPLPSSSLIARRLGALRGQLAATPKYIATHGKPNRLSDLAAHRCLRFRGQQPQKSWELLDRSGQLHHPELGPGFEARSSRLLQAALFQGVGVGLTEQRIVDHGVAAGKLVRLLPSYHSQEFVLYALYPEASRKLRRVQVVVDWLASHFA